MSSISFHNKKNGDNYKSKYTSSDDEGYIDYGFSNINDDYNEQSTSYNSNNRCHFNNVTVKFEGPITFSKQVIEIAKHAKYMSDRNRK